MGGEGDERALSLTGAVGFTLIELIITIAVAAILLSIGIPMIGSFLVNDQTQSAAGRFEQNLQWARAEAIKTNQVVSVAISGNNASGLASFCAWQITAPNSSRAPQQTQSDFQNHYPRVGCQVTGTTLCFTAIGNLGSGGSCQPGGIYTFVNSSSGSNQWLVIASPGGQIISCLQGKTAGQCQ